MTTSSDEGRPDFKRAKAVNRPRKVRRFSLRLLREALGKTQVEVAEKADMNQSDLSKLEGRADLKLSTLNRYLGALGADVEVTAVFPSGRRFVLDLGGPPAAVGAELAEELGPTADLRPPTAEAHRHEQSEPRTATVAIGVRPARRSR